MTRNQMASLVGEIIFLAKQGKVQSEIAHCAGVKPNLVYEICQRYGIKTKHPRKKEREKRVVPLRHIQCALPLQG